MIERIKQNKSLVDIKLTALACKEHYQNEVNSFVIVSSDSDYWGLISSMPDAGFLVMIEREKCGPDMKTALADTGVFYLRSMSLRIDEEGNVSIELKRK